MSNKRVTTIEWSKLDPETRDAIRNYVKPRAKQKRWVKEEIRKLKALVKKGISWENIAAELNRTIPSCITKYRGAHV